MESDTRPQRSHRTEPVGHRDKQALMNKSTISIIVALDESRAIGKDNGLLWSIPEDLRHFRELTLGHPIIMGRKTFESIGKPLPGRGNIVITRNKDFGPEGCIVVDSFDEALEKALALNNNEIFIIGGGQIYAQALPKADKLYITLVSGQHEADVFFPAYENKFKKIKEESRNNGEYRYAFIELERIRNE